MSSAISPRVSVTAQQVPQQPPLVAATEQRYLTLDAFRGFAMLVLCSGGLGLRALRGNPTYQAFSSQFQHLPWAGLMIWELVMPSFMFMVGFSLALSQQRRQQRVASFSQNLRHVAFRAFKLILIGQMLTCYHNGRYSYEPYETLTQLGLSYFCCFWIIQLRPRLQPLAALLLISINWGLYVVFPGHNGPFAPEDNIGAVIDRAVFGLNHAGDWATINFLGSTVTVLFGAWTALLLTSGQTYRRKIQILMACIIGSFTAALVLHPINPVIHKAWTATFTFTHTGILLVLVLVFLWLFDVRGYHKLAFPLLVVGMNSIFIYLLHEMLTDWLSKLVGAFTGKFEWAGGVGPALQLCAVALVMWYVCYWLYQRRIFFKI